MKTKNNILRNLLLGIGLLILVLTPSYYFYSKYQQLKKTQTDSSLAEKESQDLIIKVDKLILLPKGETPTIATVSDIEKLKKQIFFANAVNGDKVLIYPKAKKAILYDPFLNKIIEVGPLTLPSISPTITPTIFPTVSQITPTTTVSPTIPAITITNFQISASASPTIIK